MPIHLHHRERHRIDLIGGLRAAVLGANDGIVSTASLVMGIAAAGGDRASVLVAGVAGLVAGAMAMAAGEYVSVYSQADTEAADVVRELAEIEANPAAELVELTQIYEHRGLDSALARQVAEQLMAHDAIGAHARDELGMSDTLSARPLQAALLSAASFAVGAFVPIALTMLAPAKDMSAVVAGFSLLSLAVLGAVSARVGGANVGRGAARVALWGALAMAVTSAVGSLFGVAA